MAESPHTETVLFVCTANMIRSAFAAGYAAQMVLPRYPSAWHASGAGTHAAMGYPAMPEAVTEAMEHGVDLSGHRSQPITPELLEQATTVICMAESHADFIRRVAPWALPKVRLGGQWLKPPQLDIDDPVGQPQEAYGPIFRQIVEAVDRWAEEEFGVERP